MNHKAQHMAVDQYGNTYHGLGPHPRKALLERFSRKRADIMYVDNKKTGTRQCGWIIAGHWLTVYVVKPINT